MIQPAQRKPRLAENRLSIAEVETLRDKARADRDGARSYTEYAVKQNRVRQLTGLLHRLRRKA